MRSGLARTSSTVSPEVVRKSVNAWLTGANRVKGPSAARSSAVGSAAVTSATRVENSGSA